MVGIAVFLFKKNLQNPGNPGARNLKSKTEVSGADPARAQGGRGVQSVRGGARRCVQSVRGGRARCGQAVWTRSGD